MSFSFPIDTRRVSAIVNKTRVDDAYLQFFVSLMAIADGMLGYIHENGNVVPSSISSSDESGFSTAVTNITTALGTIKTNANTILGYADSQE